ncbi:hypothetical protein [Sphingomonas sp. PAMC 26617]|uniref:hypothetical protein n=1 Tax=Sphingomonas sp. PAMC 26617 TaxID=1112216 RepID=UPI0018DED352|nr:hypothetical protein [Sphingomonas sp. PAMC 26617]
MKEFILDQLAFGGRKEVIAAVWEYVLWLEIAYKIIEKDKVRTYRDSRLTAGFQKLENAFIRLFETARRRAIIFNRKSITEDDYFAALNELGWKVLKDLDREIVDLLPKGSELLLELLSQSDGLTSEKFRYFCGKRINNADDINRLLDIMILSGSIGVIEGGVTRYMFNTGYKRQYLSAKMKANPQIELVIHSTFMTAIL